MENGQTKPIDSDLAVRLPRLETAVCKALADWQAGTPDPFAARLDDYHRSENLKALGSALGYRYVNATLGGFQIYDDRQEAVVKRLMTFADTMPNHLMRSGGLLLFGPPGTGKDHLLAALLKIAVSAHRLSVTWFDGGDLFDEIYFAIKAEHSTELKALDRSLRRPHILAISDPQPPQGPLSDSQIRRLRDVIDARYRAGLSTWITTNLDRRPDAVAVLTEPVLQRLKEGSAVIDCNWPSYRERIKPTW